jgi:O-antigen/teichoic acid export membrane protein
MKHETIATIALLLTVVATGPVGALPLSLSILATYAFIRKIAQRQKVSKGAERATALAFGAFAIPMLVFLVSLWSATFDLSFQVGGAVWLGIIASLEHGLQIAARWNEQRKAAPDVDSLLEAKQAA